MTRAAGEVDLIIGSNMRKVRQQHGLSQSVVADELEVSFQQFRRLKEWFLSDDLQL